MSKKTNTNQRGGASPLRWRFMDQSDARLSEWGGDEEIDVSPIDGEILERMDIRPQAWQYYVRLRKKGVCPPLGQVGARLCLMDEDKAKIVIIGVSLILGVIAGEVQSRWETKTQAIEFLDFFLLSTASRCKMYPGMIMSALYLEGLFESIDAGHPLHAYVFELLMHRAKGIAATRPTREELAELTPFLDFLAETEAGKAVQSELMGNTETKQKDLLINYVCHPDKQRVHDELCAYMKGMQGQKLAEVVRLCISWQILNRKPPFDVLRDAGAKGTESAYKRAMSRNKNYDPGMVQAVKKMAR